MRLLFLFALIGLVAFTGCKEPAPAAGTAAANAAQQEELGEVEMERVKAQAGVGKQGQIIGNKTGFIRTPAKALIHTKQKAEFMKVDYAVKLYEAEHGFKPKTHNEFMSKIVDFNNIVLPELPEGQVYIWDPETGELQVEKPKS